VNSTLTPAAFATHAFEYVLPSQPQTWLTTAAQSSGLRAHVPGASLRPQFALAGKLQYSPSAQGPTPRVPHTRPIVLGVGHWPVAFTEAPFAAASHALP